LDEAATLVEETGLVALLRNLAGDNQSNMMPKAVSTKAL
jgi:hypothetical protein